MAEGDTKGSGTTPRAPAVAERFVRALNIAFKAVKLYPGASEIPRESSIAAIEALRRLLEQQPVVRFVINREGIFYDGSQALSDSPGFRQFAKDLYARNLAEVRFHSGCTDADLLRFLSVATLSPEELLELGGFERGLWELDVTSITVTETVKRIVDGDTYAEAAEAAGAAGVLEGWPPSPERAEEIVAGAAVGQHDEQRLLVRMIGEPELVRRYVGVGEFSGGRRLSDALLSMRVEALASGVASEVPGERESLMRQIAETVLDLEPEVRQRLVAKRLISDARRGNDAVASVLREMTFTEIMDCVLHGVDDTAESRSGVARAIRYLSLIGLSTPQQSILTEATAAMQGRGLSEAFVRSVTDRAAPKRIDIHPRSQQSTADPIDSVLRLIDLTPDRSGPHAFDESLAPLREEAARGLTDGDIVAALVTVTTLETRLEYIGTLATLVEDRIAYLLDQQEFEVAADAAVTLTAAEKDASLSEAQRQRMRELLTVLSKPESMRRLTNAMRIYRHDSPEYAACKRLLGVLGSYTVSSLLEVLADEQDMTGRKAIVDLLSGMAERFVPELAARLDDNRWYFVRNVVGILGSIHDPATLQYLGRTLRHSDERVRRETIRAIAGIRDALATEMLVAALADDSAQNVQLAARYLGAIGGRGVLAGLEQVAKGEGRGNRENGPRIEAVEALGRIGGGSSLQVLEEIVRQRGLMAGRTREIRTAAEAAVEAMRARGVTEGTTT